MQVRIALSSALLLFVAVCSAHIAASVAQDDLLDGLDGLGISSEDIEAHLKSPSGTADEFDFTFKELRDEENQAEKARQEIEEREKSNTELYPIGSEVSVIEGMTEYEALMGSGKNVLLELYANWCGHCREFSRDYKLTAQALRNYTEVAVVAVNIDRSPDIARHLNPTGGIPAVYFHKNTSKPTDKLMDYDDSRQAANLVYFVNEHAGTQAMTIGYRELAVERAKRKGFISLFTRPGNVVNVLNKTNFVETITKKHTIVYFYTDWCMPCRRFATHYESIADLFEDIERVSIAAMNIDDNQALAAHYDIKFVPEMLWFTRGHDMKKLPMKFDGQINAQSIVQFLNEKLGTRLLMEHMAAKDALSPGVPEDKDPDEEYEEGPSDVRMYGNDPFVEEVEGKENVPAVIENPGKHVIVEFYAHWCSFCKQMKPVFRELGAAFSKSHDVQVIAVNGDLTPSALTEYSITGYPTIKMFRKGSKKMKPDSYDGSHSTADLIRWVNGKTGARGSLNLVRELMQQEEMKAKAKKVDDGNMEDRLGRIEETLNKMAGQ